MHRYGPLRILQLSSRDRHVYTVASWSTTHQHQHNTTSATTQSLSPSTQFDTSHRHNARETHHRLAGRRRTRPQALLRPKDPHSQLLRLRHRLPRVGAVPRNDVAAHDAFRRIHGLFGACRRHPIRLLCSGGQLCTFPHSVPGRGHSIPLLPPGRKRRSEHVLV